MARSRCVLVFLLLVLLSLEGASSASRLAPDAGSPPDRARPATAAATADRFASPVETVRAMEYHAGRSSRGLQAPNRRHGLRTFFEPTGIRVENRVDAHHTTLLRLALERVGREGTWTRPTPGSVETDGARVEIRRPDLALVEWYVNSPAGLEQGFDLARRPAGDGPLVLDFSVEDASVSVDRRVVRFRASDAGRTLGFGKLATFDAHGRALESRFEAAPSGFRIVVNDGAATYPIVIDPLLTETHDSELESNQPDADFGESVARAGDVNGDGYEDVIVGVPSFDDGQTDEGIALVFHGGPGGLGDRNPLDADTHLASNQAGARFGNRVASAGDVNGDGFDDVMVGAPDYDVLGSDDGAAWIWLGGPGGIADGDPTNAATILAGDQPAGAFGSDVASAGDVNGDGFDDVLVGAQYYDAPEPNEGAAFLFYGGPQGVASGGVATADARFESNQVTAHLGARVAGAGDVNSDGFDDIAIGGSRYDATAIDTGVALVFHGGSGGIASGDAAAADTFIASAEAYAFLGSAIAAAGDVDGDEFGDLLVGASSRDASGVLNSGTAEIWYGSANGLESRPGYFSLSTLQQSAEFGTAVAGGRDVNGDGYADVVVGARFGTEATSVSGAAYVYLGRAGGIPSAAPADFVLEPYLENQSYSRFGDDVAFADVNGDGYADSIVGAPEFSDPQAREGAVFVYRGAARGVRPSPADGEIRSYQGGSELGTSVATAGDVNGDGYADVIVGAPNFDNGETLEGAAMIFLGDAVGIGEASPANVHALIESDQGFALLGNSVGTAGDVNGDGFDDVIVGSGAYVETHFYGGAAFVFHGSAGGIADGSPSTADGRVIGDETLGVLGSSVSTAGDVNGDGYADVIVGAPGMDWNRGRAYVFHGGAAGIGLRGPADADTTLDPGSSYYGAMGASVSSAGDVNGDGFADVIVGAPTYGTIGFSGGAAFVFHGRPGGIPDAGSATADARIDSDTSGGSLGKSVAGVGDLDADGFDDVVVGAHGLDIGSFVNRAAVFVHHGGPSGVGDGSFSEYDSRIILLEESPSFGNGLGWTGDVNGDGYDDLALATRVPACPDGCGGRVFLMHGSEDGVSGGWVSHAADQTLTADPSEIEGFGAVAAGAGDVDGDGFADVIVGAPDAINEQGVAQVFLSERGRGVFARALRGDGSGIEIRPWSWSGSDDAFEVEMTITSSLGRERAKLEIEACPTGVPFGHASCGTSLSPDWLDLGSTGVVVGHRIEGLDTGVAHQWRARAVYAALSADPVTAIGRPGPWRRGIVPGRALVRVPEPGFVIGVAIACGLLFALRPRRPRVPPRAERTRPRPPPASAAHHVAAGDPGILRPGGRTVACARCEPRKVDDLRSGSSRRAAAVERRRRAGAGWTSTRRVGSEVTRRRRPGRCSGVERGSPHCRGVAAPRASRSRQGRRSGQEGLLDTPSEGEGRGLCDPTRRRDRCTAARAAPPQGSKRARRSGGRIGHASLGCAKSRLRTRATAS